MNPHPITPILNHRLNRPRLWSTGLSLLLLLAAGPVVRAQDALMARPEYNITPPALQEVQTDNLQVFTPETRNRPLLQLGPISIRPHAFYRALYADHLPSATNSYVASVVQQISPGFNFGLGSHWSLDYTPTWTFYSSRAFQNTLDHSVRLTGGTAYNDWVLNLSQTYLATTQPTVETGTQTAQETFGTALGASYQFNSKMSMDLSVNQNIVSTEKFSSYNDWSTLDWFNYKFGEKIETAIGLGVGYTDTAPDPNASNPAATDSDMSYEQIQTRIGWRATDKLSLGVHAGLEIRQFLLTDRTIVNPVVGAKIQYQPIDVTQLSLNIERSVGTSYFDNQATENLEITAGVHQRLLSFLNLDVSVGYHRTEYISATGVNTRTDDYYSLNSRLVTTFLAGHATAGVFYQYSNNKSTVSTFSFDGNQIGLDLECRF